MKMFKGFNKDLQCNPDGGKAFQYEIGKTYEEESAELCDHGFHACEMPLDVLGYYPPGYGSRYCEVKMDGVTDETHSDSKRCGTKITIGAEIGIPGLAKAHVEYVNEHIDTSKKQQEMDGNYSAATNTGYYSAATNTGECSAATNTGECSAATNTGNYSAATNTGYCSAATNTGNRSAATNTGNYSAATNTGYYSAATNTGNRSAATNTGNYSAATNTGYYSAATNTGNYSAATNTGYYSAATNTGNRSAATNTGYRSAAEVSGADSIAIVTGYRSKARGALGCWLVLTERNDVMEIMGMVCVIVDGITVKADTWYMLIDGELKEVACND